MNILFVCTGNTCRSSMAEGICKHILNENNIKDINVSSAGIYAFEGEPANEKAIEVLRVRGIDIKGHKARQLTKSMIEDSDLVLTMTNNHKMLILSSFPEYSHKVYTLKEYAAKENNESIDGKYLDIADPYGLSYRVYEECADEIETQINLIWRKKMKIVLACDHGGFELKEAIKEHLINNGYNIVDIGVYNTNSVDYPDYGKKAAEMVASNEVERGIIICGTGIGISIAANKVKGIRCALCTNEYMAKMSRLHNDANMLALGARVIGKGIAMDIVDAWLSTEFEGGRHENRVNKLMDIEKY